MVFLEEGTHCWMDGFDVSKPGGTLSLICSCLTCCLRYKVSAVVATMLASSHSTSPWHWGSLISLQPWAKIINCHLEAYGKVLQGLLEIYWLQIFGNAIIFIMETKPDLFLLCYGSINWLICLSDSLFLSLNLKLCLLACIYQIIRMPVKLLQ